MADLPHPWDAYARRQEELSRKSLVDGQAWGLEAGLNLILASDPAVNPPSQVEIDRTVASAARLERYRAVLRAQYLEEEPVDLGSSLRIIEARQMLRLIKKSVPNPDWVLLCEVAAGHEYREIA